MHKSRSAIKDSPDLAVRSGELLSSGAAVLLDFVANDKEIDYQANPAGAENQHRKNDFAPQLGCGLFGEQLVNSINGENNANPIN